MYYRFIVSTLCSIVVFQPGSAQLRDAASGWSTTYIAAQQSMVQINENQIPESLAYQSSKSRVITSNILGDSKVMGAALAIGIDGRTVTFYEADMYTEFDTNNPNSGTFGVKIDPVDDTILWSAQGQYPPTATSSCAIQKTNLTSGDVLNIYNFANFANDGTGCLLNDIVIQASNGVVTNVYATDYYGYRIYKLDTQNGQRSVLSSNETLLRTGSSSTTSGNGPNGIALYTDAQFEDWLILGVAPDRLVKMSTSTGSGLIIEPGINTPTHSPITTQDGMFMQAPLYPSDTNYLNYILYVVGATALPNGTVQVLTSTTEWTTYELRSVYSAGCGGSSYAPAVTLAAEDLLVLCNNDFVPGYANVNRVTDVTWGINPLAATISTQVLVNMIPESMSYDPNRNMIVMGSLSDGTIRGWPYNAIYQTDGVTYGSSDAHVYVQGGTDGMYSTAGINVNPYNVAGSDCYCFVCMGSYPPDQTKNPQTALYLVDLCSDSIVDFISLPPAASTSMANDMTTLNGKLYVTDYYGNQVYSVDFNQKTLTMSNAQVILTANDCATNDFSFCVSGPDGIEMVAYGGKLAEDGFLIISMLNTGLMKYVPSTKMLYKIQDPTGVVWGFDGMRFNNDGTVLYGTRNPGNGDVYQTVMAVSSCNYWENATLVYSFQLNCDNTNAVAVWPVGNTFGSEDLLILCNDNFGPGPYTVQRIFDVNNIVSNQANNLSPGSCSSESVSSRASSCYRFNLSVWITAALISLSSVLF